MVRKSIVAFALVVSLGFSAQSAQANLWGDFADYLTSSIANGSADVGITVGFP